MVLLCWKVFWSFWPPLVIDPLEERGHCVVWGSDQKGGWVTATEQEQEELCLQSRRCPVVPCHPHLPSSSGQKRTVNWSRQGPPMHQILQKWRSCWCCPPPLSSQDTGRGKGAHGMHGGGRKLCYNLGLWPATKTGTVASVHLSMNCCHPCFLSSYEIY